MHVTGVLKQWSPAQLQLRGKIQVQVKYLVFRGTLSLLVVGGEGASRLHPLCQSPRRMGVSRSVEITDVVNTAVLPDVYPLPTVSELFSSLAAGILITKLDLKQAYQQLVLDEKAAELLTMNTHRGLFRPTRLQFGVSMAVAIFERAGIPGVQAYLDEIFITGKSLDSG